MENIYNLIIPLVVSILGAVLTFFLSYGKLENRVVNIEKFIDEIRKDLKELRDKTIICETILKERQPLIQSKSPLSLTERGLKVLNESGGKTYVENNLEYLKEQIKKLNPETAYDIQEFSRKILEERQNNNDFKPLKDYAFKEGLNINDIIGVMGLFLRDFTLSDFGYNLEEIGD